MKKLLVLGLVAASAFAYMDCAMCHQGSKSLSKYTPAQLTKMLNDMKSGKMNVPAMTSVVSGMSAADIKAAAKKYGKK